MNDHDHRGEYADDRHDHDLDYAEKHHRHYDDERELASVRRDLDHVIADLRELRGDLEAALGRIRVLEQQTPAARQAGQDDFVQDRHADLDPNRGEADDR